MQGPITTWPAASSARDRRSESTTMMTAQNQSIDLLFDLVASDLAARTLSMRPRSTFSKLQHFLLSRTIQSYWLANTNKIDLEPTRCVLRTRNPIRMAARNAVMGRRSRRPDYCRLAR
jgi:hypothetical protein